VLDMVSRGDGGSDRGVIFSGSGSLYALRGSGEESYSWYTGNRGEERAEIVERYFVEGVGDSMVVCSGGEASRWRRMLMLIFLKVSSYREASYVVGTMYGTPAFEGVVIGAGMLSSMRGERGGLITGSSDTGSWRRLA